MNSANLVQMTLDALSCNQKELALRVGVSPTQVSKWKRGEYISSDMEQRLRDLAGIGDMDPDFISLAGSMGDAKKWSRLIDYLADLAYDGAETGYNTSPLEDDEDTRRLLHWSTLHALKEMGVSLPERFPQELDIEYEIDARDFESDEAHAEQVSDLIEGNPHARTIRNLFDSFNDVYGFYAAYVSALIYDDDLELFDTGAENIEPSLMLLAACKLEIDPGLAPGFRRFRARIKKDYEEWLGIVKDRAFRAGVPLGAELLDLVHESSDALGHEAEAESFGFNASRIHPDIYMNELLVGMRVIHQVLPAIMKKLGIADEFELDASELHQGD